MTARFRRTVRKVKYQPVDWFRIIADLKLLGLSHHKVALAIDVHTSSIGDYARGATSPNYDNGEKLIGLWRRETNKHHPPRVHFQ